MIKQLNKQILARLGPAIERVLIPSNSSLDNTPNIAAQLGIDDNPADKYRDTRLGLEVMRYRAEDIPAQCNYWCSKGISSLGITGRDLLEEFMLETGTSPFTIVTQLDMPPLLPEQKYRYPTLCLIGPAGCDLAICERGIPIVVNRKYANLARRFLDQLSQSTRTTLSEPRYLSGKIENEIGCDADFGIDIVFSGSTLRYVDKKSKILRSPQLVVVREILESPLVGIVPQTGTPASTNIMETQTYKSLQLSGSASWQ
jgi:ATP phosphoribosyltransferase